MTKTEEEIDRDEWRDEQLQKCFACGRNPGWGVHFDIHEISRRKFKGAFHRCNYLLLCSGYGFQGCHNRFDIGGRDRKVIQLAVKQIIDIDNYDLTEWLSRFDPGSRSPDDEQYITQGEVDDAADAWKAGNHEQNRD